MTLLTVLLSSIVYQTSLAESAKGKYVHVPTKWVQVEVPDRRINGVNKLLAGTGYATWGKAVVIKPGDFEVGDSRITSDKGLRLLRDLSFNGVTLKKGCLIVLTGYPNYLKNDYLVDAIDCRDGIAIVSGKQFTGVFDTSEVIVEKVLAPTLGSLEVKESFKLPTGRLIKKGTRLKADGQWFPELPTNVFEILPEPNDP